MIGYMVPYVAASTTMEPKTVGGRRRRPPTVLEEAGDRPIVVDAATYVTIYPIMKWHQNLTVAPVLRSPEL